MSKPSIVADGYERLTRGRCADLAKRRARLSIRCRPILQRATFIGRLLIRWRMRRIIRRAIRRSEPSPQSLYGTAGFIARPSARAAAS